MLRHCNLEGEMCVGIICQVDIGICIMAMISMGNMCI